MKPLIEVKPLDGGGLSPHPSHMGDADKDRKGQDAAREAKLAQALRANLRRRKAAARPPPAKPKDADASG